MPINIPVTQSENPNLPTFTSASDIKFGSVFGNYMFLSEYENGEWKNPRIVPYGNISVSPAMSSLHYGQAVFEGMKVVKKDGKIFLFRVKDNAKRLNRSLERMSMATIPEELFVQAFEEYVKAEANFILDLEGVTLYLRPFVFATDAALGMRPSSGYTFSIISCLAGTYYAKPLRLKIEQNYTRASRGGVGAAKAAGNYAASMYPSSEAQKEGFDQVIWTDSSEHAYIEESGTMNVAFLVNGTIVTPQLSDSILAGITRDSFLTLARKENISVEERLVSIEEICKGIQDGSVTEAFGMGTAVGLSFIESITHKGVEYKLPAVEDKISARIAKKLSDIKQGIGEDTEGWISMVQ